MAVAPSRSSSRSRNGFTLTEILVVLVVLGALVALLVPMFNNARETARAATCAGKLTQVGLAMRLYNEDYGGLYPSVSAIRGNCTWVDRMQPYVQRMDIFECPAAPYGEYRPGCPAPELDGENVQDYHGSYAMKILGPERHFRVRDLTHPDSTILILDTVSNSQRFIGFGNEPITGPPFLMAHGVPDRHRGGDNVLFADGHVKWLSLQTMTDRHLWVAGVMPTTKPTPAP